MKGVAPISAPRFVDAINRPSRFRIAPILPPSDDSKLGHDQQLDLTATVVRAFFDAHVYAAPAGLTALRTGGDPNLTPQVKAE